MIAAQPCRNPSVTIRKEVRENQAGHVTALFGDSEVLASLTVRDALDLRCRYQLGRDRQLREHFQVGHGGRTHRVGVRPLSRSREGWRRSSAHGAGGYSLIF